MRLIVGSITAFLACVFAHAAEAPPAVFGAWTFDATLSRNADAGDAAANNAGAARPADSGRAHGGGGHHGGGGMGGMGGGVGGEGGGSRHGGHHGSSGASAGKGANESDAEKRERGLARLFTTQLTITQTSQRIRFDDGEHPVELGTDGMNLSGAGVGGTIALTATAPEFVIDTLTDSGYALQEHYRLSDDGAHLELHASLKQPGSDGAHDILRVFDRATAAANRNTSPAQAPVR